MAITTYAELKTAIESWASRTDLTSQLDDFIALTEDRLWYGDESINLEPLRVRAMETSEDLTISSQETALPTGFLQARRFYLSANPHIEMDYMPPDRFWAANAAANGTSGKPVIYTIEGENIVVAPSPDSTYTGKLLSWKKLTGLSSGNTTNWLITNSPGTYLYGCLMELAAYVDDGDTLARNAGEFVGRVNSLNTQAERARHSGAMLSVRPDRAAPNIGRYAHWKWN